MKCQIIKCNGSRNFRIRPMVKCVDGGGPYVQLDIPEEVYNEICKKLNSKPYTGIHKQIFELIYPRRGMYTDRDAILDYLYCNGFDYLFEE